MKISNNKQQQLETVLSSRCPKGGIGCKSVIDRLKAVKDVKSCRLKK